ncbi:BamA/TamA family outer membrane protein [Tellurirhabdus bombi]|uniref:hypothetical protein n=1 Tax=Tellurirhabdus bombi TaxID=2907205 RepID=UPI001F1E6C06|nr:hypothetical protein [Tellurirhabdus bombi]
MAVIFQNRLVLPVIGIMLLYTLLATSVLAQNKPQPKPKPKPVRADSTSDAIADSILIDRDSVFYSQLKTRMHKRRLTKQLYRLLFRDVYNSRVQSGEVSELESNPFQKYEGKVIGDIYIRRLEVFGQSVYDTTRKAANWVAKTGNRLHRDTREGTIRRSFLLFEKGQRVDANQLRDNERLLRNTNIFHDARIIVVPRKESDEFVDIYVITQDVWSLEPAGSFGGFNRFALGMNQRNFRGFGHTLFNYVSYRRNDTIQKAAYRGRYLIPYIGKTFLTGQADVIYERDLRQFGARIFRPFLTPDTRVAGSLEISHTQLPRNRIYLPNDSIQLFPLAYNFSDMWIGYAFRPILGFMDPEDRTRVIVAGRITNYDFVRRPEVINPDTNQLYQNTRTFLLSIGLSKRRYTRDVLIYGFGRTEDVPYGSQSSIVTGIDYAELGPRMYLGIKYSKAQYIRKVGYIYGLFNLGGYVKTGRGIEQGVLTSEVNYFSPLRTGTWGNWRHFINLQYATGYNRFNNEFISISGRERFGPNNDALRGTRFLLGNVETILFSKLDILGFRVAVIPSVNLGLISYTDRQSLWKGPLYQSYGIGFRFRNENLTFNSFQIRLAWYPNLPNNPQALRFAFNGIPALRFRDFDVAAPEIIPYR